MITTTSIIESLYSWRKDKLALVLLIALMGTDTGSTTEAWIKLDDLIPTMRELKLQTTPSAKNRINLNHDTCKRVLDLAEEIEPWLRKLAEVEEIA